MHKVARLCLRPILTPFSFYDLNETYRVCDPLGGQHIGTRVKVTCQGQEVKKVILRSFQWPNIYLFHYSYSSHQIWLKFGSDMHSGITKNDIFSIFTLDKILMGLGVGEGQIMNFFKHGRVVCQIVSIEVTINIQLKFLFLKVIERSI